MCINSVKFYKEERIEILRHYLKNIKQMFMMKDVPTSLITLTGKSHKVKVWTVLWSFHTKKTTMGKSVSKAATSLNTVTNVINWRNDPVYKTLLPIDS